MSVSRPENPVAWFQTVGAHYLEAQAMFHLNQVGVLAELHRGPATVAQVAERLHLQEDVLRTLLEYLTGIDHLLYQDEQDRFGVTEFGREVFARFARDDSRQEFNFFDVRVGCLGPVWDNLSDMLTGAKVYGKDIHRNGQYASGTVTKFSRHLTKTINWAIAACNPSHVAVLGVTPGLMDVVAVNHPEVSLIGLDRDPAALETIREVATGAPVQLVHGDIFKVADWADDLKGDSPPETGLFLSVHFHEFATAGAETIKALMNDLSAQFPGWYVLAIEQERLYNHQRADTPEILWLYAQANVLIHHLISNAKILTREEWLGVLGGEKTKVVDSTDTGYLGYRGYLVSL